MTAAPLHVLAYDGGDAGSLPLSVGLPERCCIPSCPAAFMLSLF